MRRFAGCLAVAAFIATPAAAQTLRFIGDFSLPAGLEIRGTPFGGLSALEYYPLTDSYLALSDDRAEFGPARYYSLHLGADAGGLHTLNIRYQIRLRSPAGEPLPEGSVDPEGVRRLPNGRLLWISESDGNGVPYIGEMDPKGTQLAAYELPAYHIPAEGRGARDDLAFESLTLTSDGNYAIAAHENALVQDGPTAEAAPSPVRMTVFEIEAGTPVSEFVYMVEPVAVSPEGESFSTSGLVELLADPDGETIYALERSYTEGRGYVVRIFRVLRDAATDVLGVESLAEAEYTPVTKQLLATLADGDPIARIDNLQGMTFGPEIDGQRTLVLVSDNNFSQGQVTQFLMFAIAE